MEQKRETIDDVLDYYEVIPEHVARRVIKYAAYEVGRLRTALERIANQPCHGVWDAGAIELQEIARKTLADSASPSTET